MNGSELPAGLTARAAAGALAHAYILAGPDQSTLAAGRALAAAMECVGTGGRPCGTCRACRKVEKDIHPDVILVAPEEGKDLTVDQVRQVRRDAYIPPNEGARKVFLFREAQRMNLSAQNALLKVLEEGPPYAAFLLLTPNAAALLPTIRSRCETVRLQGDPDWGKNAARKGEELAALLMGEDRWALCAWCAAQEKGKREDAAAILEQARQAVLRDRTPKTTRRAVEVAQGLDELRVAARQNVSLTALWGWVLALK